ncbi:MAG: TonB-dependent hemoglobin/transferrin/lactoferrin family receptor [Pseudomonadales bacterium]|nr:TonB-dependent hemoglobin/transferrin/lactoferrin family receptor [Pseudomonadales bacterium]MBO6595288.1 TonB-dependent hemoglobin/transferrin/lactoferrin family receptor [Pseudomonadales bacterium]MBO6821153.1 TonB-dependent hemoglobin/transferrin/lactoferrin family receptor [Pseudomonadales bacterium]
MTNRKLCLAVCIASLITTPTKANEIEETITVIGTRTERSLEEVAATISVRTVEDIEREMARDIADLVRFEPGVSVSGTGDRFGLSGFNIRGIEGNRVLTLVDGIRVAEEFSFGPFLSSRRDYVDIDSLSRAEIARGPISSLWGSDALGGVVAFTTKSPSDYLSEDQATHVSVKAGYSSTDSSTVVTTTLAGGNETISGLLLYTARNGEETETAGGENGFGPTREEADPQDVDTDNIVAKLEWRVAESHRLTFGFENFENQTDTQVYSDYNTLSRGVLVNTRDAVDERERTRYSIRYDYDGQGLFADNATVTFYQQASETSQTTLELRSPPFVLQQVRTRDSYFDQDIDGAMAQLTKLFEVGSTTHTVTYGVDYYKTDNASLRDGGTVDINGGFVFEFFPLPTRDFPITEVTQVAFFVQDEISLMDGRLLISPSLRYDEFDANVNADSIYRNGNPGVPEPVDFDDSEVTGKLGVVYRFNNELSVFGRYSEGFRAPPYDDVNVGFTNFIGGYKTISNPNLVSETSEGWEVGLRFQTEYAQATFTAFTNDYEDFIEELSTIGIDFSDGLLTFQSINLSEVEINGAELAMDLDLTNNGFDGFTLRAAIAYAEGEDKTTNEPLNSIEPLSAVLGLGYDAPSSKWGGDLIWTLSAGKEESDIDANNPRIETAGYGTLDLLAYFNINESWTVNAGIFNLTDKEYIRWADTTAIGADAPGRFTQPGINGSVTVRFEL